MFMLIGIAGSIGAALRYSLGSLINKIGKPLSPFPIGTWVLNISGSFLLGFILNLYRTNSIQEMTWLIFGVGFCGAYTTFSTFGTETISLIMNKRFYLASFYVISSCLVGILSAWFGYVL